MVHLNLNLYVEGLKIFDHFSKIAEDFRGRPEDVSIIHQRI